MIPGVNISRIASVAGIKGAGSVQNPSAGDLGGRAL